MTVTLDMGACGCQEVKYFHQHSNDVDWVFVDHPSYHRAGVFHANLLQIWHALPAQSCPVLPFLFTELLRLVLQKKVSRRLLYNSL